MLILGLLLGPNKNEVHLSVTSNYSTSRNIRIAVICCSNDILASRKLCSHASALIGCHQYYKRASSKNRQRPNFREFNNMFDWFKVKDLIEHHRNALIWKKQQMNDDKK
ncbi:6035_t:CDS:2 [Funneliformis caledonium]|uniref:6035_t:CDS:1 n=1 Tax=Funneliformis caledonium TaxID=1117310 RepID=A0A9N9HGV5_9GLOM|nr:6035_t:CDS:2 [Funneliformis caledonium]